MKWIFVSEKEPEFKGWHLCRIGGINGHRLPLMISRASLIVDAAGKSYKANEVEWLDESVLDQDILWDEVAEISVGKTKEEGLKLLKPLYTLIRK